MSEQYKGNLVAPFRLYSSSAEPKGYLSKISSSFKPNVDITNLHEDLYGHNLEVGLQGPFAQTHVGGHQRRHVDLNTGSQTDTERPEAFYINFTSTNNIHLNSPGLLVVGGNEIHTQSNSITTLSSDISGTNGWVRIVNGSTSSFLPSDVVSSPVKFGTYSLRESNSPGNDVELRYTFDAASGTLYRFSFWLYGDDGDGDYKFARWGGVIPFTQNINGAGLGTWTYNSVDVIATSSVVTAVIVADNTADDTFFWDGVSIVPIYTASVPTARFYREPVAQRPLVIKNIQSTTSSLKMGNFFKNYEVVSISGRTNNNIDFRKAEGHGLSASLNPILNITQSYAKPQRTGSKSVFIERFSAPGDKYSIGDSDGGQGLDSIAAEFSPYSTPNYRNYDPRFKAQISAKYGGLQKALSQHAEFGGTLWGPAGLITDNLVYYFDSYEAARNYSGGDRVLKWNNEATASDFYVERKAIGPSNLAPLLSSSALPNGGPALSFNGVDQYMDFGSGSLMPDSTSSLSLYVVLRQEHINGSGDFSAVLVDGIYNASYDWFIFGEFYEGDGYYSYYADSVLFGENFYISNPIEDRNWHIISYLRDKDTVEGYKDNTLDDTDTTLTYPHTSYGAVLGAAGEGDHYNDALNYYFSGSIAAILLYNKKHNEEEREQVQSYLNRRYFGKEQHSNELLIPTHNKVPKNSSRRIEIADKFVDEELHTVVGFDAPDTISSTSNNYSFVSGSGDSETTVYQGFFTSSASGTVLRKRLGSVLLDTGSEYSLGITSYTDLPQVRLYSETFKVGGSNLDITLSSGSNNTIQKVQYDGLFPYIDFVYNIDYANMHFSPNAASDTFGNEDVTGSFGTLGWEFLETGSAVLSYATSSISGSYSLSVTTLSDQTASIVYRFPTVPGMKYYVEFAHQTETSATDTRGLNWINFDESVGVNLNTVPWFHYGVTVTANAHSGGIVFYPSYNNVAAGDTLRIDGLRIYELTGAAGELYPNIDAVSLFANEAENNQTSGWLPDSSGDFPTITSSTDSLVSNFSMYVSGNTSGDSEQGVYMTGSFYESGSHYIVSFYYKINDYNGHALTGSNLRTIDTDQQFTLLLTGSGWTPYAAKLAANSTSNTFNFYLAPEGVSVTGSELYLDAFSIRKVVNPYIMIDDISVTRNILSQSVTTASVNNNMYISTAIPASDTRYQWIKESYISAPLNYATASDDIIYASGSDIQITI